jgi:hypothetical protein
MKRTTVWLIAVVVVSLAVQFSFLSNAVRADNTLIISTAKVNVDGVADPAEYTYTSEKKGLKLFLTRTASSLYAAVIADTTGWVGIGFKSDKMDKAEILIGYVKDGKGSLFEQFAQGNTHNDKNIPYVKSFALTESGSSTILEVELDAKGVVSSEQKTLPLILAYGGDDTITSYHKARTPVTVKLGD